MARRTNRGCSQCLFMQERWSLRSPTWPPPAPADRASGERDGAHECRAMQRASMMSTCGSRIFEWAPRRHRHARGKIRPAHSHSVIHKTQTRLTRLWHQGGGETTCCTPNNPCRLGAKTCRLTNQHLPSLGPTRADGPNNVATFGY